MKIDLTHNEVQAIRASLTIRVKQVERKFGEETPTSKRLKLILAKLEPSNTKDWADAFQQKHKQETDEQYKAWLER